MAVQRTDCHAMCMTVETMQSVITTSHPCNMMEKSAEPLKCIERRGSAMRTLVFADVLVVEMPTLSMGTGSSLWRDEPPRRHTAKRTTPNAEQPTQARRFAWLIHCESMMHVVDR